MTGIRAAAYDYVREDGALFGSGAVRGLLGTTADPALYPHGAPANAPFPYVVSKRVDRPEQRTLSGTRGLRSASFDYEVWGDDTDVVESVVEALRARLESVPGKHSGDLHFRSVSLEGEVDDSVRPEDGTEVTWFVTILTVRFTYVNLSEGA